MLCVLNECYFSCDLYIPSKNCFDPCDEQEEKSMTKKQLRNHRETDIDEIRIAAISDQTFFFLTALFNAA